DPYLSGAAGSCPPQAPNSIKELSGLSVYDSSRIRLEGLDHGGGFLVERSAMGIHWAAAAGPIPDELSIDSSHVKVRRSASGSKRGSLKKRSAARGTEGRARFMLWPMIAADRSLSRCRQETSPTSSWPFRFSAPALNQSACWRTRPTTPTVCADGSSIGR